MSSFSVTGEGLRIDLMETEQGMFFVTGQSDRPRRGRTCCGLWPRAGKCRTGWSSRATRTPGRSAMPRPPAGYGNWELSVDRANAARRLLHAYGIAASQVVEVRGFADQQLLNGADPADPKNRRVSVVIKV